MNLRILNKANFSQKFLKPLSMISDLCILNLSSDKISATARRPEFNSSLYAYSDDIQFSGPDTNLNIGDLKKFIKLMDCIPSDDVELSLNPNNISYKSNNTKFKYHLIEDGIIQPSNINLELLESTGFDLTFEIPVTSFQFLLKSSVITNTNKVYLSTSEGCVLGELDDKAQSNIDTFATELSKEYSGEELDVALPFSMELFRSIATLKASTIKTRINKKRKLVVFDIFDGNYSLKYISSAMVI